MKPEHNLHPWSCSALFIKTKLYIQRMESLQADDWEFGFWSALGLELLARAALARTSPLLLADTAGYAGGWRNMTYAPGLPNTTKKFLPSSIGFSEVINRVQDININFTEEYVSFCKVHANRRNNELHTGELAFFNLRTSEWLPKYYQVCRVLLEIIGKDLGDLVQDPDAALELINGLEDATAKAVESDIKAYMKVWNNKKE